MARAISENPDVSPEAVAKELRKLERAREQPAGQRGGDRRSEAAENQIPNRGLNSKSNTEDLRRLKRDLPDLAQQVVDGEISLNAAAIPARKSARSSERSKHRRASGRGQQRPAPRRGKCSRQDAQKKKVAICHITLVTKRQRRRE